MPTQSPKPAPPKGAAPERERPAPVAAPVRFKDWASI
jgi:hypothetical protein